MARPRPRRALRPSPTERAVRVGVPVLLAGALLGGVAIAAWPNGDTVTAVPALSSTTPSAQALSRDGAAQRANRDSSRTALESASPSAPQAGGDQDTTTSADRSRSGGAAAKAKGDAGAKAGKTADDQTADDQTADDQDAELDLTVTATRYTTAALLLRTTAEQDAKSTRTLPTGAKVSITKTVTDGFRLVKADGKARWVTDKYLATSKPEPADDLSSAPCAKGSGMESGLTRDAIRVHRAVCAAFPQVSSYGGVRSGDGGYHGSGRAVDAMISDSEVGWRLARWVRAHAKELGVSEVIYSQQIWTVQRGGEGWRGMSNRGSATANHYDHVHVSVYGNSGTS